MPSVGGVELTVEQLAKGTHHMQTPVGRLIAQLFFGCTCIATSRTGLPVFFSFFLADTDLTKSASHLPEADCFLFTWLGKASVFFSWSPN